ncbi:MAG TPA: gliding motility-associated C-terminal domain-containing protein, partial [Chitinophagaceae bacterium]|nr:gliding motility-associated C-terminal domain-containing protein [Chitinophagaceae bacterium]
MVFIHFSFSAVAGNENTFSVLPTITIKANVSAAICPGTPVTFTASITFGGSSPSYQWKKNTINVGLNSSIYTDNTLKNGDIISCVLTSNDLLASPTIVYSNYVSLVINDGLPSVISTFAGCGSCGWGTGGLAINADMSINYFCMDSKGNIYISEELSARNKIRKIDAITGIISLVIGKDTLPGGIIPPGSYSGDGGLAVNATVNFVKGLCVDSHDNLIFADSENNIIRMINTNTGIVTRIAGTGLPGFSGDGAPAINTALSLPTGICIDSADNIYILESGNRKIRKIDGQTGIISTIANLGGVIPNPFIKEQICVGPCGNLYVTTFEGNLIRKIDPNTGIISDVSPITGASGHTGGLSFDRWGNLFCVDLINHYLRKISAGSGINSIIAGNGNPSSTGDGGPAINASLSPRTVMADKAGNLYVADDFLMRKISSVVANVPAVAPTINVLDTILCVGNSISMDVKHCNDSLYGLNAAKEWKWYTNSCGGIPVGTGASIIVSPTVTTTYYVRGEGNCIAPGPCSSKTITVYPIVTPSISISSNPSGLICRGTTITFTATAGNTGNTPIYQWKRNGVNIGTNANSFTSSGLSHGDVITCQLTSNAYCVTTASVTSNPITLTFYPDNVTIAPRTAQICVNGSLQINASGGLAYQWYRDGSLIPGAVNASYAATQEGTYLVRVTNVNCVIPDSCIVSLDIPEAILSPSSAPVCSGSSRFLSASGGTTYQWYRDGSLIPGASGDSYSANQAGTYMVAVSDGICTSNSNPSVLYLASSPKSKRYNTVRVASNKPYTLEARTGGQSYLWDPVTDLSNPTIVDPVITTLQDRLYTITISTASDPCDIIDTLFVQVFDKPAVFVPAAFTPNNDGLNDLLIPIPVHIKGFGFFRVYNRWGEIVFQTSTLNDGWNGKSKGLTQPAGVYIWIYEARD